MFKFKLANLDGLDEATAKFYEKHDDGAYYLKVEGAVAKDRLDEFRTKNIEISKKLERFDGVDPDEYKTLKTQVNELKTQLEAKGKELTEEEINKLLQDRTKSMRDDYESKLKESSDKVEVLNRQLESLVIDGAIRTAAMAGDVAKTAVEDVVMRAKSVFKLDKTGAAMPYDRDGKVMYGKNGADPMTPSEWIKGLKNDAPHLFAQPKGGGSSGSPGGGGTGDRNNMSPLQKVAAGLNSRTST